MDGGGHRGEIRGNMVFESIFTDVTKQLLQIRNLHHSGSAECFESIVGEFSFAHVAGNSSFTVIRGEAGETHRAALHPPYTRAERVVFADRARDDFLEVHAHIPEKVLWQVAAVEAHGFVRIIRVIIIPVEQSAGGLRSELEGVHANHPSDIHLAGAG